MCLLALLWQLWAERLGPNMGPRVATAASTASLLDSTGAALSVTFSVSAQLQQPTGWLYFERRPLTQGGFQCRRLPPGEWFGRNDQFFERQKLPKLNQEELENLNNIKM